MCVRTCPQVCFPGAYRCVCVHLRLMNLAVNAIGKADAVAELEGGATAVDAIGCGPAFRILRQLLLNWLHDATQFSNM